MSGQVCSSLFLIKTLSYKPENGCFYLNVPTLPGVGEGDGVSVDVVLPLDDVFLLRDDLMGVTEELPLVPLVELLGDVVLDMFLKADGTWDLLKTCQLRRLLNVHI